MEFHETLRLMMKRTMREGRNCILEAGEMLWRKEQGNVPWFT
jgi:hypothetical protein